MKTSIVTNGKGEEFELTEEEERFFRAIKRLEKMNPGRLLLFGTGRLSVRINELGYCNEIYPTSIQCDGVMIFNNVVMEWIKVEPDNLPKQGIPVIGFSRSWIDRNFNPCGIRECFITDAGGWYSAKWLDEQDDYTADYKSIPEYWMPMPQPPLNF